MRPPIKRMKKQQLAPSVTNSGRSLVSTNLCHFYVLEIRSSVYSTSIDDVPSSKQSMSPPLSQLLPHTKMHRNKTQHRVHTHNTQRGSYRPAASWFDHNPPRGKKKAGTTTSPPGTNTKPLQQPSFVLLACPLPIDRHSTLQSLQASLHKKTGRRGKKQKKNDHANRTISGGTVQALCCCISPDFNAAIRPHSCMYSIRTPPPKTLHLSLPLPLPLPRCMGMCMCMLPPYLFRAQAHNFRNPASTRSPETGVVTRPSEQKKPIKTKQ